MIGSIDIKLNAANPNIPLKTIFSYVNSPSSIRVIDVPKKIGKWSITQVIISATYPDNSIVSSSCVLCGGVWTGTIEGSTSVGKSLNGYVISANGTDENGNEVTGYVLGKGDVVILDADGRTIIDGKVTYLHLLDTTPEDPKEGDVILEDGNWKIYHENEWIDFGGKNPTWGHITGVIEDQTDLIEKFDIIDTRLEDVENDLTIVKSDVTILSSDLISTDNKVADNTRDISETNTKVNSISSDLSTLNIEIVDIKEKIPTNASSQNQLATQGFVNSSINAFAAFYITRDASGNAFQTYAQLSSATLFFNAGLVRLPTKNDYLIILEDETKTTSLGVNPTTRYTYQGVYPDGQWEFQYIVNNTSLTQAQVDAINSGITKEIVDTRVVPSDINSGWAANADFASTAGLADYANNAALADYANTSYQSELSLYAEHANNADTAMTADYATQADQALTASYAYNADTAMTADYALTAETANYADNAAYANVAEYASNLPTPLEGMTFDFTNNAAIYESLSVLITMLGGTVTNIPQRKQFYKVTAADDARIVTRDLLTYQIEGLPVKSFFEGNIQAGSTIAEDVEKIGLGGRAGLNCIIQYMMNGVQGTVTSSGITWINLTGDLTITYAEGDM